MLATLLLCALAHPAPQDATAPAWVGCWRALGDSGDVLMLEPERAGWLRDGKPGFHRLHVEGDELTLERWGSLTKLSVSFDGEGRLQVEGQDLSLTLESCEVPRTLKVEPYAWPEDVQVDADVVAAMGDDLAARRKEDQRVRQFSGQPSEAEMQEMVRVDEDNLEFLLGVVEEFGWIDAQRFGREAADAAFLIVQHCSDLRLMRSALPSIEADVRAGRLGGQAYALLFDRFQLNLGHLQRYGSQIGRSAEFGSVLMPCEDLESIDERRAEMGMGPLSEYLELFRDSPESAPPAHLPDLMAG